MNLRKDCHGKNPPHVVHRMSTSEPGVTSIRPEPRHLGHRLCRTIRSPNRTAATINGMVRAILPKIISAPGVTASPTTISGAERAGKARHVARFVRLHAPAPLYSGVASVNAEVRFELPTNAIS